MVYGISFYIDGAERSCGAKILALAATDTFFGIYDRHFHLFAVDLFLHHLDCPRRAVTRTSTTMVAVGDGDAVLLDPHGMPDVNGGLLLFGDWFDCTGGADLTATGTLGTAVAALKGHLGLHEPQRVSRWAQDVIRTRADA